MNQYGMNRFTCTKPVPPEQIINFFFWGIFAAFSQKYESTGSVRDEPVHAVFLCIN